MNGDGVILLYICLYCKLQVYLTCWMANERRQESPPPLDSLSAFWDCLLETVAAVAAVLVVVDFVADQRIVLASLGVWRQEPKCS